MLLIRLLEPGDEGLLLRLAAEAVDFGMSDSGDSLTPLDAEQAARYLNQDTVAHWVAFEGDELVGSLVTMLLPLPVQPGVEVLLYEIGVRSDCRRRGVGSALVRSMDEWMAARGLESAWVLADNPEAEPFYRACGFEAEKPAPVYMTRSRGTT